MKQYTRIVEASNRVYEIRVRRGRRCGPGRWRWRVRVELLAGPEPTEEEAAELMKRVVADLVAKGIDVTKWGY